MRVRDYLFLSSVFEKRPILFPITSLFPFDSIDLLPRSIILYNSSFLFVYWILLSLWVLSLALALIIFEIFCMFVSCPSCWEGACGVCRPVIQCARNIRGNEWLDIWYVRANVSESLQWQLHHISFTFSTHLLSNPYEFTQCDSTWPLFLN